MKRMKTYENRGCFHTYRNAENTNYNHSLRQSGKIHTGVCGVIQERVYVTQANAQIKRYAGGDARVASEVFA
jgi:hypothetical protein